MKSNENEENNRIIQSAIKSILESIGEDVTREGLLDTPKRISELYDDGKEEDGFLYTKWSTEKSS